MLNLPTELSMNTRETNKRLNTLFCNETVYRLSVYLKMKNSPNVKNQGQGFVDLRKKSKVELNELLERQLKLLQNKSFLAKLLDKGEKIKSFKSQIEDELKKRDEINSVADVLSQINLNGALDDVEWNGGNLQCEEENKKKCEDKMDDDEDDNIDPLKLLATHCGTQRSRIKKETREEPSLVTEKDIKEAKSFEDAFYAQQLCKKYDRKEVQERFKPNQPKSKEGLKSAFKSSSENVQKKLGKYWEITSATPPVPIHGDTKQISLSESLALQKEQAKKLKDFQFNEALKRLQNSCGIKMSSSLPTTNLMQYRTPIDQTSLFEGTPVADSHETEVVLDDDEKGGLSATFYNIVDDVGDK